MAASPSHTAATPTEMWGASSLARIGALFRTTRLGGVVLVLALLCLWEASARFGLIQSVNWPPFSAVLVALFRGLADGELVSVIGSTLWRMARGYAIGCAIGVPLGIAVALSRPVRWTLEPTIELLRPIPVPAIIPPLIFVFGINDPLKLFAVAFAVLFPVALNTIERRRVGRPDLRTGGANLRRLARADAVPRRISGLASLRAGRAAHQPRARPGASAVVAEMIAGNWTASAIT